MRKNAAAIVFFIASALASHSVVAGPALLMEPATGLVLYAEDADQPWRPASLTKLMTAYLAFEAIRDGKLSPEDVVNCSERAFSQPPSKLGLPVGGQLKVELAIKALIVKSANDVAIMLAEKIGGTEANFVEMMNNTAKRLGMTATSFVNPNGLSNQAADGSETGPQAVTTARDMALLASMILKEFPQYTELFSMTEVRVGNRMLQTHNSLLRVYDGADGMKTGFVCAAGYNVVGSATRNGRKLLAVVLGEKSGGARTLRAAALFEYGFAIYPWKAVLAPTLAGLSMTPPENPSAPDMRSAVCNARVIANANRARRAAMRPPHKGSPAARRRSKGTGTAAAAPLASGGN